MIKGVEVIFILKYRRDPFALPDVKSSISNHPCIAAGTGSAERMVMVYEKCTRMSLEDKPSVMECFEEGLPVRTTPSNIPKWASCGLYKNSGLGEMRLMG